MERSFSGPDAWNGELFDFLQKSLALIIVSGLVIYLVFPVFRQLRRSFPQNATTPPLF
jgi:hypothetical protein